MNSAIGFVVLLLMLAVMSFVGISMVFWLNDKNDEN